MPMPIQTVNVPTGYCRFDTRPSTHLGESKIHQLPQVSYSQQAQKPNYIPDKTICTTIPSRHNLPNLGAWTFSEQKTSHQPSVVFSHTSANHSFATHIISSKNITKSNFTVILIISGGAVYYCNPPNLAACFMSSFLASVPSVSSSYQFTFHSMTVSAMLTQKT